MIIIWKLQESGRPDIFMGDENENSENWIVFKMLRGHIEDVADLSWSSDAAMLASGSVDNSAVLWDVQKGNTFKQITFSSYKLK